MSFRTIDPVEHSLGPGSSACPADAPEPSPETPTNGAERSPLDRASLRAGGRGRNGRFLRGNLCAMQHGLSIRGDHADLSAALVERETAITSDLGGIAGLSAMQLPLVRELARLQLFTESAGHDLVAAGIYTARGRARAGVLVYLRLLDHQQRLATLLGLERKARRAATATELLRGEG